MAKKVAKSERQPLTVALVDTIVVANTPKHPRDPARNTQLKTLGIVDGESAEMHKEGIRSDVSDTGWRINPDKIDSSPTTTIAVCRNSVLNNAK